MSVNTVAVQLIIRAGVDSVMQLAKKMGITAKIPREPGIALGSVDATLLEMVRLFSTFANRGVVPTTYSLTRIETDDGKPIAEFQPPDPKSFPRVLQAQHADMVRYLLQSVVDGGTGGRLRYMTNFIYPAAGKTGTTNNNSDGWFVGFTPNIAVGAWVGAELPLVRWRSTRMGQGGATALPVCGKFLTKVYNDPAFKDWQKNNFPPLQGAAAGAFSCPDYIPAGNSLLDSLYALENMHPDSMSAEERAEKILKIKELLRLGGYQDPDSTAVPEEGVPAEGEQGQQENRRDRDVTLSNEQRRESERVQRHNERLERKRDRKKKRKEFFDDLLGKKD
jgi:penicillin-binding protein 1A